MIHPKRWSLSVFAGLLAAVAVAACDNAPLANDISLAPEGSAASARSTSGTLRLVAGFVSPDSVRADSAVIERSGGRLIVAGHMLEVPGNAVSEPTMFKMRLRDNGSVGVDLRAFQRDASGAYTVDVGARGFNRPVALTIGYEYITEPVDPSKLLVVWVKPDGTLEALFTKVYRQSADLYSELEHFSDYAIGFPDAL